MLSTSAKTETIWNDCLGASTYEFYLQNILHWSVTQTREEIVNCNSMERLGCKLRRDFSDRQEKIWRMT